MSEPKKTGRPKGPRALPPLHPATLAAIAAAVPSGAGPPLTVAFDPAGDLVGATPETASKRHVREGLAAVSVAIEPRLLALAIELAAARQHPSTRELAAARAEAFGRVARVAAAVGDAAFFRHAAEAVAVADKAAGTPRRLLFVRAWLACRNGSEDPLWLDVKAWMEYRLGTIDGAAGPGDMRVIPGYVSRDELKNFARELRLACRGRPRVKK